MDTAIEAHRIGHRVVIVNKGSKAPLHRNFPDRQLDEDEICWHRQRGYNWGLLLRGLMVADKDASNRKAYDWMRHHRIHRSPMEVQSKRGVHFYFRMAEIEDETRSKIKLLGMPLDFLTGNRFAIGPGSIVEGHMYALRAGSELLAPEALPAFPAAILQRQEESRVSVHQVLCLPEERVMRYIDRIEPSVQGQNGSGSCFTAALKCLSLAGGDVQQAWEFLLYFNRTRCLPLWDEELDNGPDSLKRKLREAHKVWKPRT